MMNFTPELVEKAKAAQTAEELLSLAKATGVEMTAAEAATDFAQLNPKTGELSDDDLDNVAGGSCRAADSEYGKIAIVTSGQTCPKCGHNRGEIVCGGYGLDGIFCEKCDKRIANTVDCTYEIVG